MASTAKAGKRPLRSLTAHEKLNAIKRVSVGGESKASVARDIGVPESTLRGWCKNQEKISYQVRTSPSNVDESPENGSSLPPSKRTKIEDQPYNLSMKTSDVSNESYSLQSESVEYPKYVPEPERDPSPLNLRVANGVPITSTPKGTDKEREKNRAELARISSELGLNRPEVFLSNLNGVTNFNDFNTVITHWKNVYQTWIYHNQQKLLQQHSKVNNKSPPNSSHNQGLLNSVEQTDKILPSLEQQPSVYDSVSYWLKLNHATSIATPTTSSTVTSSTGTSINAASLSADQTSQMRFWNWYQQSALNAAQGQTQAQPVPTSSTPVTPPPAPQPQQEQQLLYQQLTKEEVPEVNNTENELAKEEKPKTNGVNGTKPRSVLDNLLLNNNTIDYSPSQEELLAVDAEEAVHCGQKFLYWLERCSDPSVTTVQLHIVQSLIKNLKSNFERKSNANPIRNKVKRK